MGRPAAQSLYLAAHGDNRRITGQARGTQAAGAAEEIEWGRDREPGYRGCGRETGKVLLTGGELRRHMKKVRGKNTPEKQQANPVGPLEPQSRGGVQ